MGRIFAAVYDRMLASTEEAGLREQRARLVGRAQGVVVEIGAGTGLNFEHYDRSAVERLVLCEPDPHMARKLRERVGKGADVIEAPAERLPLEDGIADTVVGTLVLCTVDDPETALAEVARVLKPGGRLLAFEHVRSDDPGRAKWQDRLERPWGWFGAGCHPNRDTLATLQASPLRVVESEDTRLPKAPPVVRPALVAVAERPPG